MKALVTGGSGFLGRYLVRELVNQGIETVIFDTVSPPEDFLNGMSDYATFVKGDILDLDHLIQSIDGCDIVFHTAAIADLDDARKKPVQTMNVNVVGTAHCLEAARIAGVKRFLLASSVYVSGKWGSFYKVSKQAGESLCKTYNEEYGLSYTILRYGSLYGRDANQWNSMYAICTALLSTGTFHYVSGPEAIREYIHIHDAARETISIAMDKTFENRVALITGPQRMTIRELFDMMEEIIGKKITITYTPPHERCHYIKTPYTFDIEVPIRVNLSSFIDINEGILDCLYEVQKEIVDKNSMEESQCH